MPSFYVSWTGDNGGCFVTESYAKGNRGDLAKKILEVSNREERIRVRARSILAASKEKMQKLEIESGPWYYQLGRNQAIHDLWASMEAKDESPLFSND